MQVVVCAKMHSVGDVGGAPYTSTSALGMANLGN